MLRIMSEMRSENRNNTQFLTYSNCNRIIGHFKTYLAVARAVVRHNAMFGATLGQRRTGLRQVDGRLYSTVHSSYTFYNQKHFI